MNTTSVKQKVQTETTATARDQQEFAAGMEQAWQEMVVRLLAVEGRRRPSVVGVTSAVRGEGKTTSSINIAGGLANETDQPVVLVGAAQGRFTVSQAFDLNGGPGLREVIEGSHSLEAALSPTQLRNLAVMGLGGGSPLRDESLAWFAGKMRRRLPEVLALLKQQFAYAVFDLPPLLSHAGVSGLVHEMDGAVLIVRPGLTPVAALDEAVQMLPPEQLLGVAYVGEPSDIPPWVKRLRLE